MVLLGDGESWKDVLSVMAQGKGLVCICRSGDCWLRAGGFNRANEVIVELTRLLFSRLWLCAANLGIFG